MLIVLGVAVGLIVFGLLICFLSGSAGKAATVFWWLGIVLAVVGGLLLLEPIVVYVAEHLKQAIGAHGGTP